MKMASAAVVQFNHPAGIEVDGAGYLYVAESGNNSIRVDRIVPPSLQFFIATSRYWWCHTGGVGGICFGDSRHVERRGLDAIDQWRGAGRQQFYFDEHA